MLRKIRIGFAALFLVGITLLFLNIEGTRSYLGWMAQIQFLPALLALNVVALAFLLLLTLLFGRIYCSTICPLGVMQDIFAWIGKLKIFRKSKGKRANKYSYSKPKTWLRLTVLVLFIALYIAGVNAAFVLLAPYSAYGRIIATIAHPMATEVAVVACITAVVLFVLSFLNGRTYCNTICPVGTVLGYISKYGTFKRIHIDESKCVKCGLCAKNCKASCIDSDNATIDYSRCVVCGDCEGSCAHGAISFGNSSTPSTPSTRDMSRRGFLGVMGLAAASAVSAQEKTTDGGFAAIVDKQVPKRNTPLTPPGSLSARNMQKHCTACQLCISNCPNNVLRPSTDMEHFMQPEMGYENGYCRPECTKCSKICPAGAIKPITREEKTAIHIGHAVWVKKNCIPLTDGQTCGNCARHCPTGAIQMVPIDKTLKQNEDGKWQDKDGNILKDREVLKIPVINTEYCIGCGACENLCPSRPFSAIYVEGHEVHRVD